MDSSDLSGAGGGGIFDVAVVGGGPAGLSAAVAGGRMNRRTVCFETGTPRTAHAPRYYNYLGFPDGISGREMLDLGRTQARRWGSEVRDVPVTGVVPLEGAEARFQLETAAGPVRARGLILATGIADRQPRCGNLYGERGIHYCVVCDGYETRGERVAVVGHDAAAFEMVRALRDFTPDLHLLLDGHAPTLAEEERAALEAWGVRLETAELPRHSCGEDGVTLHTSAGRDLVYPHLFVALGVEPNTDLARELGCRLDDGGFIVTDERQRTSVPFVYAAGDCDGGHKQVTQAMAEGELAAIELATLLRETAGPVLGSGSTEND